MIYAHADLQFHPAEIGLKPAEAKRLVYFDIETTGIRPSDSFMYLISTAVFHNETLSLEQFFAESLSEEALILSRFLEKLSPDSVLVTYNGDHFDIPYVQHCIERYHKNFYLTSLPSMDIYRSVRSIRNYLGLERIRQKDCEEFLGIFRKDPFNGGELISVYEEYVRTKNPDLVPPLLLHNREDVLNLMRVAALKNYADFFREPVMDSYRTEEITREDQRYFCFNGSVKTVFPKEISFSDKQGILYRFSDSRFRIEVPILTETLRHYFDDYRNYVYLIEEKIVLPKRMATGVEKSRYVKATAENCCVETTDDFLPVFGPTDAKIFRYFAKDCRTYCRLNELNADVYLHMLLQKLSSGLRCK